MSDQADVQTLDIANLSAIADRDPVECARLITVRARLRGNLPTDESDLRKECLKRARKEDGRKVNWLAARVGVAMSGISRLTKPKAVAARTEAA